MSKKEGRIRGYVYLVSRCTLFIITASFLFTNVLFTNIRNDTPDTTTYTTNTVGNPKSINCDNQLKQLSNSSIYTYTTIKRKLLIQAGTETNPGPTIISLLSPITREKEDSKFITVYCRDGLKTFNFSTIIYVSSTLKECLSSVCTCPVLSSCCLSIILPDYEVETLSNVDILLSEGSVHICELEKSTKLLQCLQDFKCNIDIKSNYLDPSIQVTTPNSVPNTSTMGTSLISIHNKTSSAELSLSSPTNLLVETVEPTTSILSLPREPSFHCRFDCGFWGTTKSQLKNHYKRKICKDLKNDYELVNELQPDRVSSITQASESVSTTDLLQSQDNMKEHEVLPVSTNGLNISPQQNFFENQILIGSCNLDQVQNQVPEVFSTDEDQTEKVYICPKCGKTFSTDRNLKDHLRHVHRPRQLCDICPQSFSTSWNLHRHKQNVHCNSESKVQCDQCHKSLKNREHLQAHKSSCPKRTHQERECQKCNRIFTTTSNLRRHIIRQHKINSNNGDFMIVTKIIKKYRKVTKKFICFMCPQLKKFSSNFSLKRHIHSIHQGHTDRIIVGSSIFYLSMEQQQKMKERTEDCLLCQEKFECVDDLRDHKRIHHGIDTHQCQNCDKTFKKQGSLRVHVHRVHSSTTHQCTLCNKVFVDKYTLGQHYNLHINPLKLRNIKPLDSLSHKQFQRRIKMEAHNINSKINENSERGKTLLWKELIKHNPDMIYNVTVPLEENEIVDLIKDASLSDRKMLIVLQKIREKWGRQCITPNIRDHLVKRKTILNRFFTCRLLTGSGKNKTDVCFESKDGTPIRRYVVYCHDLPGLIAWKSLLEGEDITEYMNVIGVDDGKSLLKICWNWSTKSKDEGKYKLIGPKRSIILACVFDVPETSHNIGILFNLISLNEIDFLLSEDLKLHNVTLGKQSHSSKHPCSYCDGFFDVTIRRWVKGNDITLKSLRSDRKQWMEEGKGDRSQLQRFNNVENEALVSFDENEKILVKIPPPALHVCLIGPVNYIINQLEKVYPDISKDIERLHIVRERYQGKTFEGICYSSYP